MNSPVERPIPVDIEGGMGSRLSAKGTRPSYHNSSGNGIEVASMCAVLYEYRPVAANEGGKQSEPRWKAGIS